MKDEDAPPRHNLRMSILQVIRWPNTVRSSTADSGVRAL